MRLFRNIKQKFCKHYFIYDAEDTDVDNTNTIRHPAFKCYRCGLVLHYDNDIVMSAALDNTALKDAEIQHKYWDLLRKTNPGRYAKEKRKENK
ncbi:MULTISPECIES: hypothetical protein [Lactobacillus]|uniref:Uncharacterized protein n=1 Tax=Lactobacillus xujianguonis TaxID=2495899 RepID=A0A437SSU8_9LACO|nr:MULTISPECIES: hypothetical protein [Lactobacillus]RVU70026.1 hypothetical protein EJK17_09835 [Lactobacillus xujianguonis]RVU73443.1 hypothetical protein EJK20_08145 [Lactobacillus xujianguonis]